MKPILFNTEMVQAILDGRKTVTRRVVKSRNWFKQIDNYNGGYQGRYIMTNLINGILKEFTEMVHPPYKIGDILYVRETWCELCHVDENGITHYDKTRYFYKTDGDYQIDLYDDNGFYLDDQRIKWKPSIHMSKEAARIFLRITDVRVERLQDINGKDRHNEVLKEGYPFGRITGNPVMDFALIWNSTINKKDLGIYSYSANPWVWVIEFERVSKEEKE